MSDAMHKVFATLELVEEIQEYAASGAPWKETRNLRLVSKDWNKVAMKGLRSSTHLPQVDIDDKIVNTEEAIAKFRETYPSNVSLPIYLRVGGPYNETVYDFFVEFAPIIAQLKMIMSEERLPDLYRERFQLRMINLRKLSVEYHEMREHPCDQRPSITLLDKVLQKAENLNVFQFNFFPIADKACYMKLPIKLTHLQVNAATVSQLENLFSINDTSRLIGLEIVILGHHCLERLQSFVNAVFPNLQHLELTFCNYVVDRRHRVILPRMEKVKKFSTNMFVAMTDGSRFCDNRVLSSVVFRLSSNGLQDLSLFLAPGSVYENLKSVHIDGFLGGPLGDKNVLLALQEAELPSCPSLESLRVNGFFIEVLFELLPKIFSTWKTIKFFMFVVCGSWTNPIQSSHDLVKLLTGLNLNQMPLEESLWPDCLKGSENAITTLLSLERLEISVLRKVKCQLDRFVFRAAFFTMQHLTSIQLIGKNMEVDRQMVDAWRTQGREIVYVCDQLNEE